MVETRKGNMTEQEYLDIMKVLNDIRVAVTDRHKTYMNHFVAAGGHVVGLVPLVTAIPKYKAETAEADVCEWIQGTNVGYINPFAHVVNHAPVRPQHQRPNETNLHQIIDGVKHMERLTNEMMQSTHNHERLGRLASTANYLGILQQLEEKLKLIMKL